MVLLSSEEQDGVKKAVESNTDWWSRCFVEIRPWNPLLRPRGRRVWVRIFGTPLHVWGEDCFNKVTYSFGKLVRLDELTKKHQRLDYARVQIIINGWEPIDKMVDIRVGNDLFVLRVVEEYGVPESKNNEGVYGSTNQMESNASIGTPDRRWVADDDGLHGDWSGGSVPERPLKLDSNVTGFGPVDNSITQQQLLSDTHNTVPVEACLGEDEEDDQEKNRATLHPTPIKEIEKDVVVVLDKTFEEGRLEVAAAEDCRVIGHSQHHVEMAKGIGGVGRVKVNVGKESGEVGQINCGLGRQKNDKVNKEVDLGGVDELLLKGSCSGWAQTNKFGPLLEIQQEGGVVLRDSDSEVARLGFLEAQIYGPVEDGLNNGSNYKGRRKGGLHSKKKKNNKQGAPKCVRFANAVQNARRSKPDCRGSSVMQSSEEVSQCSDPIQTPSVAAGSDDMMCAPEVSDVISFNNESLVDGIPKCNNQVDPANFRIEAERLFNIGMNLGISSNEDRIVMVERLIDSNGVEDLVGDVEVDR
ncbi:hypothetical protein P8452_47526 [Trifolium repens]|nr:hypothetical protein P8452_47526 [Trifolium repens]